MRIIVDVAVHVKSQFL